MKILMTIPIYNEEKQLARQIKILDKFLNSNPDIKTLFDFEFLDNNSNDITPDILKALAPEYDWLKFRRIKFKGVGAALRYSWIDSQYSHYGYMDLDFSTDLSALSHVQQHLSKYSMVVGSRFLPQSVVSGRKLKRKVSSWCFNKFARVLFSNNLSDLMCGFKFIEADVYHRISHNLTENKGWFLCAEILLTVNHLGFPVKEIPVVLRESSHSNVKIIGLSIEYICNMFELKKKFLIDNRLNP